MNHQVQLNLQSLGENKTGYHPENIKFVSTDENFKKSPHLLTCFFSYVSDDVLLCKAML